MKVFPEDLMQSVLIADALHRQRLGEPAQQFKPQQRVWIEPWFNFLGWLMGSLVVVLPRAPYRRVVHRINAWLGGRPDFATPDLADRQAQAVAMAQRLYKETGEWPAMMVLTSHPETVGSLEWLRFELVRQGLLVADAVVDAHPKGGLYRANPECFLAIDPYALDTVAAPAAGWYAAFMHRLYLVWDRMSATQSALQRIVFLRGTSYIRIAYRLIRKLRQGHPIVMVLSGGLPQNARLLYTAREFVHRLPLRRWPISKREAQKKWMGVLVRPIEGPMPCETGSLPPATLAALTALLSEWGFIPADQTRLMTEFMAEFRLDVPYRTRLFRVLLKRVVLKGKPLLLVAARHRDQEPHIQIAAPWGIYRDAAGQLQELRGVKESQPLSGPVRLAIDFSKQFQA